MLGLDGPSDAEHATAFPTEVSHLKRTDLLGHTKGLFYQISGDAAPTRILSDEAR